MSVRTLTPKKPETRPINLDPVDSYSGSLPPAAVALDGTRVEIGELEAAAELVRSTGKLGLRGGPVDGFAVYRTYCRARSRLLRSASSDS